MRTSMMVTASVVCALAALAVAQREPEQDKAHTYAIVDTDQSKTYDDRTAITAPSKGKPYFGQDAQHDGNQPSYKDNGDGTVTDRVTGLMWQKSVGEKGTFAQVTAAAKSFDLAGHTDWRMPTIKELYSLILFSGQDLGPQTSSGGIPFIDTKFFDFEYGDPSTGERLIDAQWASSTTYVGGNLVFGVNFADGRIKGYPITMPGRRTKTFFVRYVRGNTAYGKNKFKDNNDGTVSDLATGLTWSKDDSGKGMDWKEALAYAQELNGKNHLGHSDWRLPNAKELQSIVDYKRSPSTTNSAAIDPVFKTTQITDDAGRRNWAFYWTSTTHAAVRGAQAGVYVAFGEALGYMGGRWFDVHGAGAQRSDPKSGDPARYAGGRGPQGDAVHIDNYVRVVRDTGK